MALNLVSAEHCHVPNNLEENKRRNVERKSANYHPSVWGDYFIKSSPDDLKPDAQSKERVDKLKEEVKRMLESSVSNSVEELNLIDAIQRLGVAYHFEGLIANKLAKVFNSYKGIKDDIISDLHKASLRFRLLRQEGYRVPSNVFDKFKDEQGNFKYSLVDDVRGLLSLYEAAHFAIHGEETLDKAIDFATKHLKSTLPQIEQPLATLVEFSLDKPLRKSVERLQTRRYISIYEQERERNPILLEFSKLDFNVLQMMHLKELHEISRWWKSWDFGTKLPFIRDRLVECYFWILGAYFEPQFSQGRLITTRIISLASIMDDIYDVYGTKEELELFTEAIQRWDRSYLEKLPDFMKLHFNALLDAVDEFEKELSLEGKSYRISYLKEAFKEVSRSYFKETQWATQGYVPTLEEYMDVSFISSAYPMLVLVSFVGMGDIPSKEDFEWIKSKPKLIQAASTICRFKDDIQSNQLEQERGHVASCIQVYMNETGRNYEEACGKFARMASNAWKDINEGCLKPTTVPMPLCIRVVNFARVIELYYCSKDAYTDSRYETKESISSVLVYPIPI